MILGMTDQNKLRRSGIIRSGAKDPNTGYPKNTPFFVMKDAPELAKTIGEKPTEIYFTFLSNNKEDFLRTDLRYYTKNDLVCVSKHQKPDIAVAAYYGGNKTNASRFDTKVQGLTNKAFPDIPNALLRNCAVTSCPDFISKACKPNTYIELVVPHHSMLDIYSITNTSKSAIHALLGAINKRIIQIGFGVGNKGSAFAGEIYRLYKVKQDTKFHKPDGSSGTAKDQDVIACEHVPFDAYITMFKDQISEEDMTILASIRSGIDVNTVFSGALPFMDHMALGTGMASSQNLLGHSENEGQEEETKKPTSEISNEAPKNFNAGPSLEDMAESPRLAGLFEELTQLRQSQSDQPQSANTAENRLKALTHFQSVEKTEAYLVSEIKKLKSKATKAPPMTEEKRKEAAAAPAKPVEATVVNEDEPMY